ncbi:speckle-type POZ protein [Nephila pilipes]|uniref:Speckle-type POZ protein n=1 Tax=Nephila pilipes TaxID=299642 RepID=A0A8X6TEV0_NEPPI|nr:speckle-type POZ protein [Nephila pilipes]
MTLDGDSNSPLFTYFWIIENCPKLLIPSGITSPRFIVENLENTIWHLLLFTIDKLSFGISIHRDTDDGPEIIKVNYQLSIAYINGSLSNERKEKFDFPKNSVRLNNPISTESIFIIRKNEFLINDTLTILLRMWGISTCISQPNVCYARSRLGIEKRTFYWRIRDFSSLQRGQEVSYSVDSTVPVTMVLCFSNDNDEIVRIKFPGNKDNRLVVFNFKIIIVNQRGNTAFCRTENDCFNTGDSFVDFLDKGRIIKDREYFLPNDVLTFRCELEIGTGCIYSAIESYRYLPQSQRRN